MPINPENAVTIPGITAQFQDYTCPDESCCGETASIATFPAEFIAAAPIAVGAMLTWRGVELHCESLTDGPVVILIPWGTVKKLNDEHHYDEVSPVLANLGEAI